MVDLRTGTTRWDYSPTPTGYLGSIGDADGDGKDDIAVTDVTGGGFLTGGWTHFVRTISGLTGKVVAEAAFATTQGRAPRVRAVRDLSGDGLADILVLGNLAGNPVKTLSSTNLSGAAHWSVEVPDSSNFESRPIIQSPDGPNVLLGEDGLGSVVRSGRTGAVLWNRPDVTRIPEIIGDADGDGASDIAYEETIVEDNSIKGVRIRVLSGADGQDVYYKSFPVAAPEGYELSFVIVDEGPVIPTGDLDGDGVWDSLLYWGIRAPNEWCCASGKTVAISQREGVVLWEFNSASFPKKLTHNGSDVNANGTQDLRWTTATQTQEGREFTTNFVDGASFEHLFSTTSIIEGDYHISLTDSLAGDFLAGSSGREVALGFAIQNEEEVYSSISKFTHPEPVFGVTVPSSTTPYSGQRLYSKGPFR